MYLQGQAADQSNGRVDAEQPKTLKVKLKTAVAKQGGSLQEGRNQLLLRVQVLLTWQ